MKVSLSVSPWRAFTFVNLPIYPKARIDTGFFLPEHGHCDAIKALL